MKTVSLRGRGVGGSIRIIIEFSSFANDEKQGRGGGLRVIIYLFIVPKYN